MNGKYFEKLHIKISVNLKNLTDFGTKFAKIWDQKI